MTAAGQLLCRQKLVSRASGFRQCLWLMLTYVGCCLLQKKSSRVKRASGVNGSGSVEPEERAAPKVVRKRPAKKAAEVRSAVVFLLVSLLWVHDCTKSCCVDVHTITRTLSAERGLLYDIYISPSVWCEYELSCTDPR